MIRLDEHQREEITQPRAFFLFGSCVSLTDPQYNTGERLRAGYRNNCLSVRLYKGSNFRLVVLG